LALEGNLGSGKTAFTKGIAVALGIDDQITSPTFVILKNYTLKTQNSKLKSLVHIDCYRISEEDAEAVGLSEYLELKNNITVVEWPENIKSLLPKRTKHIKFEHLGENKRKIVIL